MAECSASVSSATEPVIVAGDALSRMSAEFEATDSAAAPALGRRAHRLAALFAAMSSSVAGGAAAVADGVLLGRRELGHRAPVVAVVGDEDRVVAEAARRRGAAAASVPVQRPSKTRSSRSRSTSAMRADVGQRAARRARSASSLARFSASVASLAGEARRAHAGRAAERGGLDARVVGERRRAGRRGRGARLGAARCRRTSSPVSGGSSTVVGQRRDLVRGEQRGELAHLVRVAGGEDEPHRAARGDRRAPAPRAARRSPLRRARAARRGARATAACARRWPGPRRGRRRRS